jgi:2-methylisocitrate lyase-like PEP mutase family enzyme
VFGKRIKSFVFSTDLAIIKNINADAIFAVYPFTPQPIITQALLLAADIPVVTGVGGGITQGNYVVKLAGYAEMQGATGVIVNAPTTEEVIRNVREAIDIPLVATVVTDDDSYLRKIDAGASIINVSAAERTPDIVAKIRSRFEDFPIIATGGPTDETILETIAAGANAITYTPPSSSQIQKELMTKYRQEYERD